MSSIQDTPLINRVRGPYCFLRAEFFFALIYRPSAKRTGHKSTGKKKRRSVTHCTDQENDVSKIFITSLRLIRYAGKKASWNFNEI